MYLDIKITVWERFYIDQKNLTEEQLIDLFQSGKIKNIQTLYDQENELVSNSEVLIETGEEITLEQNQGSSTMALFDGAETIWENGAKQ